MYQNQKNKLWSLLWWAILERTLIHNLLTLSFVDILLIEKQQRLLKDLKGHTGLTDNELSEKITEAHFNKIADHIKNYEPFA